MPSNIVPHISRIAEAAGPLSVQRYVLDHGHQFESAQLSPAELDLISHIQWQLRQPKQCFYNCQVEATIIPATDGIQLDYVEGYFADQNGYPIFHAWLSVNHKVVDPTLRVHPKNGRVIGLIPSGWEYYGVPLPNDSVERSLQCGHIISIIDDWEHHWPLIRQAEAPENAKPEAASQ